MKKFVSRALIFAVALMGLATFSLAGDGSWTGYVTETHCGEKGAKAEHADCAVKCVKEKGAKWALYDPASKSTYVLASKEDPSKFAGKEVTVKGTMNKETKTIECTSIEAKK